MVGRMKGNKDGMELVVAVSSDPHFFMCIVRFEVAHCGKTKMSTYINF
jgi:hypothetical protein